MCYSAQADYRRFVRAFGARLDLQEFIRLYWEREQGRAIKIPKAVNVLFADPQSDDEQRIKAMIDQYNQRQAIKLEEELSAQRTRLADAARRHLDDLRRAEVEPRDGRFFAGHYAPVMVLEDGEHVIKPLRYQCRPASRRCTTGSIRVPTSPAGTTSKASGKGFSGTRTGFWPSTPSTST